MRQTNDELEERRVIRLLDRAAAGVPDLDPAETSFLINCARGLPRHHARGAAGAARRARLLVPAAAASAMAAAVLLVSTIPGSEPPDEPAPIARSLVVFPEASALALLLAQTDAT